jgi:hypothetical protein
MIREIRVGSLLQTNNAYVWAFSKPPNKFGVFDAEGHTIITANKTPGVCLGLNLMLTWGNKFEDYVAREALCVLCCGSVYWSRPSDWDVIFSNPESVTDVRVVNLT